MVAKKTAGVGKSEKRADLSTVLAQIQKEFGDGAIMRLGDDDVAAQIDAISTGALTLDLALGIGGVPRGRVIEIFGPESSGKTTLMLHIVANAQKEGGTAAFIDVEHALDPGYAKKIGVKTDELLVSQPSSGEEALNIAETLVKSNALDVVVIDSVAALAPRAELEGEMGDSHVGLQARLMSQALRKLTAAINQTQTCCLFTNQIREKIGVMFGSPETTPGGRALKFYASVRLDIRRIATLKNTAGDATGIRCKVKVVKNKVAPPFANAEFDINYAEGVSWVGSVLDGAMQYGLIEKRGSWLSYDGQQLGQGRDAACELLRADAGLCEKLVEQVKAKAHEAHAG